MKELSLTESDAENVTQHTYIFCVSYMEARWRSRETRVMSGVFHSLGSDTQRPVDFVPTIVMTYIQLGKCNNTIDSSSLKLFISIPSGLSIFSWWTRQSRRKSIDVRGALFLNQFISTSGCNSVAIPVHENLWEHCARIVRVAWKGNRARMHWSEVKRTASKQSKCACEPIKESIWLIPFLLPLTLLYAL